MSSLRPLRTLWPFIRPYAGTLIAAFLTIIGFSINDTIVIFDRIREDLRLMRNDSFKDICNLSINQTLSCTLLTSITTLLTVIMLLIFGGGAIHDFAIALFIGMAAGFIDPGHLSVKSSYLGVVLGGAILGLGFGIAGYCPGTGLAALVADLALASREFDATGAVPERNCWMAVHRHVHGVLPSEYDIRALMSAYLTGKLGGAMTVDRMFSTDLR